MKESTLIIVIAIIANTCPVLLYFFGADIWNSFNEANNSSTGDFYGGIGFLLILGTFLAVYIDHAIIANLFKRKRK